MARNSLGRDIPDTWHGKRYDPYQDPFSRMPTMDRATRPLVRRNPGESKILPSLRAAIERAGLRRVCCPRHGRSLTFGKRTRERKGGKSRGRNNKARAA